MTEIQNPKREYDADEAQSLIQEANELKKILSSILEKSKWSKFKV